VIFLSLLFVPWYAHTFFIVTPNALEKMKIHLTKHHTNSYAYLCLRELEARKRKAITKYENAQDSQEDTGEQHNIVIRIDNIS
jgi:hypothetical protein